MDAVEKDLKNRQSEIESELELLFKTNLKIVDWDVPEPDDEEAAKILWHMLDNKLQALKEKFHIE